MRNTSFVTKTRRHKKETTSMETLRARLRFLRSRVNSQSDPTIQALIKRVEEAMRNPNATWNIENYSG
jgi:hypothetical protein